MPINKFVKWAKKFMTPDKSKDVDKREAGPNPKPEFRQTGVVPEDTSGFKGNKKANFR